MHEVENMNGKLKRRTRMVAFGVAEDQPDEDQMQKYFDSVGYDGTFTVTRDRVRDIPRQLVKLIAPERYPIFH